jgi:hypothetical protein
VGEAGSTEQPGQSKERSPKKSVPEYTQHRACAGRKTARFENLFSRCFQTLPVPHTRRTDGLTASATQAAVQVFEQSRIVWADLSSLE